MKQALKISSAFQFVWGIHVNIRNNVKDIFSLLTACASIAEKEAPIQQGLVGIGD